MILSTQSLKQITSPPIGVLFTFLLYLLILPMSEVQAKTKAPIQKSTFQIAYEKAIQNKGTSFDFIDQKGNKRMYVIEKNGAINEIKSYKDFRISESKMQSNLTIIKSIETSLKSLNEEYEIGTKSITDIVDEEEKLLKANVDYLDSKRDFLLNYFKIKSLDGSLIKLFDKYLSPIN